MKWVSEGNEPGRALVAWGGRTNKAMALGAGQVAAVEAIVEGDGRPVVIVGGPGTGKSRAVDRAKELLADTPGVVVFAVRGCPLPHPRPPRPLRPRWFPRPNLRVLLAPWPG